MKLTLDLAFRSDEGWADVPEQLEVTLHDNFDKRIEEIQAIMKENPDINSIDVATDDIMDYDFKSDDITTGVEHISVYSSMWVLCIQSKYDSSLQYEYMK